MLFFDDRSRWSFIGSANGYLSVASRVLLVLHVYLEENNNADEIIRIISAREADQRERRIYLEQAPSLKRKRPS